MGETISAVEESFRQHGLGKAIMPPKLYLQLPSRGGDFRAMPAFVSELAGIKWVSVYPDNQLKNLPTVIGSLILSDPATGFPLTIMDATLITDYRTGAGAAVASKYLAAPSSRSLGLIGTGAQARAQLAAISAIFKLEKVLIWSNTEKSMDDFISSYPDYPLVKAPLETVCGCDIISTTTPTKTPIIRREWIKEGTHINAIGADAPGKQELDPQILSDAMVVVDDTAQAVHSGEVNVPISTGLFRAEDIQGTLGEIMTGIKHGRKTKSEITVFDSTGLAIQDIAVAGKLYLKAKESGAGNEIDLI